MLKYNCILVLKHINKVSVDAMSSLADLSVSFEDVASKHSAGITRDVAEYLQVLRVMRHVEYSRKQNNNN